MRVLMLSELYPPFIGGSEQHVRNLSRGLVARGHAVSVATVAPDNRPSVEDEDGVRVHRLRSTIGRFGSLQPSGRPYLPPLPDPEVTAGLRSIVADERPDVVHAHNWMVHSFLPLKARSGARLVMTLHDYSIVCAKRSLLYRQRECSGPGLEKCLRCAGRNYGFARGPLITLANWALGVPLRGAVDMFVPVSRAVAAGNRLAELGVRHEVVPNFVPDDVAETSTVDHPALAELPEVPFWLYVGALSRHKGIDVLLEAYATIPAGPPLVVIGRQSADAPRVFPATVVVLMDLPQAAVMAAWRRSSLGIVPSVFPDPCPTVALEAMAAGVPIVGSRSGGLPDLVVDGETGLLCAPGDAAALRAALCQILDDEAARLRMAAAARRRAPMYMASSVIARLEAIYDGVRA